MFLGRLVPVMCAGLRRRAVVCSLRLATSSPYPPMFFLMWPWISLTSPLKNIPTPGKWCTTCSLLCAGSRGQGLTSKRAAELFLSRCAFFMGLPSRIMSDNASIINSAFFNTLCSLSGVEMHKSIIYRPQSNGRAERAVQSIIDALRTFLEGRKQSWVTALPLALWGLNDLPGPVSPYSPHRLVFRKDPVGFGDAAPYADVDGCEDAGAFFRRLSQERETVRAKLQAAHDRAYRKFLARYPEQVFRPGDRVWVRNRIESPPLYRTVPVL